MFFNRNQTIGELIKAGSLRKIRQRVNAENCNTPDEQGYTPIHHAVTHRRANIASYLLSLGCELVIGAPGQRRSAMEGAVTSLSLPLIEAFLASGVSLPDYIDGLPLLHALVGRKALKESHFAFLLRQGLDLNQTDSRASGKTVLAYYLSLQDIRIDTLRIRWLIRLGADVNQAEQPWAAPLYQALINPSLYDRQEKISATTFSSVLDELQKGGLRMDLDLRGCKFSGLGLEALKRGHYTGFIRLLEAGVTVPEDEKVNMIPYLTSENFGLRLARRLREINQTRALDLPVSILLHDVREIRRIIQRLPHGAPGIDQMFSDLAIATHLTCNEKLTLLGMLLERGADINAPGPWGNFRLSALQIAAGWPDEVEHGGALLPWLLERGAAIECHGLSAFYLAIWHDHLEQASLLAARGADLTWRDIKQGTVFSYLFTCDSHGNRMPLSKVTAALHRLQEIYRSRGLSLPLEEPFNYNSNDYAPLDSCLTLADLAVRYNAESFMILAPALLSIGWPLNAVMQNEHFSGNLIASFMFYAHAGEDISPLLDSLPEPLDQLSEESGDPLRWALVSRVSLETVRRLIAGDDPNRVIARKMKDNIVAYNEQPLLIYSMDRAGGNNESVGQYLCGLSRLLLEQGADPNCTSKRKLTREYQHREGIIRLEFSALEWSAMLGYFDLFKLLLDHGADPRRRCCIKQEQFVHFLSTRQSDKPQSEIIRYLDELDRRGLLDIEACSGQNATPLLYAVSKCQTQLVRYFLDKGANPDAVGGFDNSAALHRAISNWGWVSGEDRRATVEMLLAAGADMNWLDPDGDSPLMCASACGCLTAIEALLAHGADPRQSNPRGRTALHEAAQEAYGYDSYPDDEECRQPHEVDEALKIAIIERLLTHGADIDAADEEGATPLLCAIRAGHEQIAGMLLRRGAHGGKPDAQGRTPLMVAAQCSDPRCVYMLENQPEAWGSRHHVAGNGDNLLHAISLRRDSDVADELFRRAVLQGEVELRANDQLITPLHYAAYRGHSAIVTFCCERGAEVNSGDDGGNTPLHTALFFDEDEVDEPQVRQMVTSLLTAGADPGKANAAGETPLAIAARRNLTDCVALMSMVAAGRSDATGPTLS
ncbi:ankyrin repeat domain-containing protein [Affinibrenneria salicis]|nr:ankyrin repeat domain-containing protein [Affinibrenneria salicis]